VPIREQPLPQGHICLQQSCMPAPKSVGYLFASLLAILHSQKSTVTHCTTNYICRKTTSTPHSITNACSLTSCSIKARTKRKAMWQYVSVQFSPTSEKCCFQCLQLIPTKRTQYAIHIYLSSITSYTFRCFYTIFRATIPLLAHELYAFLNVALKCAIYLF